MTTIAASLEMMVADSKVSWEGVGISYPTTKIIRVKNEIIGASGDGGDCVRFLEWAQNGWKNKPKFNKADENNLQSIHGLVLRKEGLFFFAPDYPYPEKINSPFYAIGSGGKAARVAMLLGKNPIEAVELACQVDDYTGPPIEVLYLDEKKK